MPDPLESSLGLRLAAVVLLLAANAFFVAAEFALVAARRTRIEAMIRRGDRKAKSVLKALEDLYRQLSAAQLGITVASIMLGYVAEDTVAQLFREWFAALPPVLGFLARGGVASTVAVSVISFLHVVIGEQAPKAWAITYPEGTSRWIATPLLVFSTITLPFTELLNWSANRVIRLLGIKGTTAEHERVHSPEEILMLVQQSGKTGRMGAQDARMIEGVFEFSEKNAREVMTPRTRMVALPATLSLADAADRVAAAGRSRYPVYQESLDDIVGTVHAKDILRALRGTEHADRTLEAILRPPLFVPGTREVEDVLADMKRQKVHLAIVLDEYDRPDAPSGGPPGGAPVPLISGSAEISEINKTYGLQLDDTDYTTIGGVVFGKLGRLPKAGDRVDLPGATFEVVEMEGRRVGKVRVERRG